MTASTVGVARHGHGARPGLRTFRSRRFRELIAATLLMIGAAVLGMAMARQAADPQGQFAIDFADYHAAAQRLATDGTPYAADMLRGPIAAQGQDRFRYPPPFAQLLVPFAGVPLGAVAVAWLLVQGAAIFASVWLAGSTAGAARSRERLLWTGVASTWFLPVFDSLWKGNVSGVIALAAASVALGGTGAGVSAVSATALKLAPVTLVPAVLAAGGRRVTLMAGSAALAVLVVSVAASPKAWADYAIVLPNLLAGSADHATNLAPSAVAAQLGAPDVLVTAVRLASLAVAVLAVVLSMVIARRPRGLPAAVALGVVAMLLLPSALWYHYLCVLLPLAALAWPAAGAAARAALVAGAALVSAALAWLPLALIGATLMVVAALPALWPAADPAPPEPSRG